MKLKTWVHKQGYCFEELLDYTLEEVFSRDEIRENLQLKDFNNDQALSDFTKEFANKRLIYNGKGARTFKLLDISYDFSKKDVNDNYINFFFVTEKTKDPDYKDKFNTQIADPQSDFKPKKDNLYTQQLRFFNFWDYLDTVPGGWQKLSSTELKNEIKNILETADVKQTCDCMSFHWQGMNWRLSQLNGSIFPTTIAPKPRTPEYPHGWANITDGGFQCKHLAILLDYGSIMFFLNQMVMKVKKILKDFPTEPEPEELAIEDVPEEELDLEGEE